jgi:phosphoribosyl 1,2-cyclic phosphodiesterase
LLRFTSLASGSSGNATLVEAQREAGARATRVLVDCGLGPRKLVRALAARGVLPDQIDAVFLTHEHSDHVGGVLALQRRYGTMIWTSAGTWAATTDGRAPSVPACVATSGVPLTIGELTLEPFAVPHDAAEPLQLVLSDGARRLGIVTDLGEPTDGVAASLQGCDALVLECNHDRRMLDEGTYPPWLKRRVGGARGHLANAQSADLLERCRHGALRHVVAAHLSRHNNLPELALGALAGALGSCPAALHVADGDSGCDWIDLD